MILIDIPEAEGANRATKAGELNLKKAEKDGRIDRINRI
jgi:hypothetical protein